MTERRTLKFLLKTVLSLLLAIAVPADCVLAQEVGQSSGSVLEQGAQIEVDAVYGEIFSLDGKLAEKQTSIEDILVQNEQERQTEAGGEENITAEDGDFRYSSPDSDTIVFEKDREEDPIQIHAVGVGDAVISVERPDGETKESASVTVHVEKAEQTIRAEDTSLILDSEPIKLQAEAEGEQLSYVSMDPDIAAVDETTGMVQGSGVGKAKIRITAAETEYYKEAEKEVVVTVAEPGSPVVSTFPLEAANVAGGIRLSWKVAAGPKFLFRKTSKTAYKKIADVSGTEYTDKTVVPGETYSYVLADSQDGLPENPKDKASVTYIVAPALTVGLASNGLQVRWNRVDGAKGYYVYRRLSTQGAWTQVLKITEPGEISWRDTSAGNGQVYYYTVQAYNGKSISPYAAQKAYVRVTAPSIKSWKKKSSTKKTIKWSRNSSATGYQIQYAQNALFSGAKTKTIKSNKTTSCTISKLKKKKTYYARIRAYKVVGKTTYYSAWSASSNTRSTRKTRATRLKKKKKVFEIRSWAKQSISQYSVLEGSCTDGTYAYYLLYNKNAGKCKIVKVKISNLKVKKVSGPLDVAHGNDMTYDSAKKRLVVVHSTGSDPKALTSVDPNTLKAIETRHITIPNKLAGGTTADAKGATAFTGIAYSSGRRQYAVLLSHNYNFVLLDADMKPIQYVKVSKKNNYTVQSIDATDDYILLAQSPKSSKQKYNIITIYDWDGNYISKIKVKKGYEIESIYHVGSKFYAGFYRSYYKTTYKKVVKKVKVKGKVKKKKVKVKQRKLQRDNYVYQITGI